MIELHQFQKAAISALWRFYKESLRGVPLIVAPTGSGKSVLQAEIINKVIKAKPAYNVLVVSHRKEILEQNLKELQGFLPQEAIGVYSAGLGMKRFRRITYCSIQSCYKAKLPVCQLVIIDECHLIPKDADSMYQKFVENVLSGDRNCKFVGLTATPYRLDQGSLIGEGALFTDICYDIEVRELIDQGFLAPLISMPSVKTVDTTGLKKSGYEYNLGEMEKLFDPVVEDHCNEIIRLGENRKSWLIFCSSVKHAEHVADCLTAKGVPTNCVTGEMINMLRDRKIDEFKSGEVRALTNCEVLTTGFNHKPVDLLVLLRATTSTALFVQMCGRGTRTAEGKKDCLVLDFGGNISRHGPIDLIKVKTKKGEKATISKMPAKTCPSCGAIVGIKTLRCPSCDYEYPLSTTKLQTLPSMEKILSEIESLPVTDFNMKVHTKEGSPPMIRFDYSSGMRRISDFLCFNHGFYPAQQAAKKWLQRGGQTPPPKTTEEAQTRFSELSDPESIRVRKDGKYYRILGLTLRAPALDCFEEHGVNL